MSKTHHGILIHAVFSTKYRKPLLLPEWQDELYGYMGGILKKHEAKLLVAGGIEDHVHLLLQIHPKFAISETIQIIKANSSRWIKEKRSFDCKFEWQRGYGAFSVSHSMYKQVADYIRNQKQHHQRQSFIDEYLAILAKHEIEYDLKYMFDEEIVG